MKGHMPSLIIDRPTKLERLVHVDSLIYYDGELLGHYTLDGEDWLVAWVDKKDLGSHYWGKHLYYSVTADDFKKFNANSMTLRETMQRSAEMWIEESKWEKLPNGHGVPDTNQDTWASCRWADIPEDERPSADSFLRRE